MLSIRNRASHRTQSGIRDGDCSDGAEADAWDTGLMVLGPEKAKEVFAGKGWRFI